MVPSMKLTVQIQALPGEHADLVLRTMAAFNAAATYAARVAFDAGVFSQPAIHARCYRDLRERFGLSAQMAVRAIGKAVETFRRDKKRCPVFRPDGAVTYDERILSWKGLDKVSLWTLDGRKILPMVFGEYQRERFDRIKGQVDLVHRDGRFYLYATIDLPEGAPVKPSSFLGVDLGVANLATTSDGEAFTGEAVEVVRVRHHKTRKSLGHRMARTQARRTRRNARRAMKRIGRRESRFRRHVNHCIAKRVVSTAKDTGRGIALEELKGIRDRTRFRRNQRARMGGWAFSELRTFVEYKARLAGVAVVSIDPRHTSRTCAECGHCEKANRPNQSTFSCRSCGHLAHADINAARNIARLGAAVDRPEVTEQRQHLAA